LQHQNRSESVVTPQTGAACFNLVRHVSKWQSFDTLKAAELADLDHKIKNLTDDIAEYQKRYDGWKQTHVWKDDPGKECWVARNSASSRVFSLAMAVWR
jgi:arginine utilization protein RocB